MTTEQRLTLLKSDLQMLTTSNDSFLTHLLGVGEAAINREGITDDGSADYDAVVISYAAYLFRKRAQSTKPYAGGQGSETSMPRFLRYMMNNLLMSQKAGGGA